MGILEAIVVVYLRQIFYSTGFKFPLKVIPGHLLRVEILREFCTVVMLLSIAIIVGKKKLQVFAYFIFCFAVWDIAYYAGLKLILNWPSSFFTWDILFLIPFPWIGPVLAPIISSLSMIVFALILLYLQNKNANFKVKFHEWFLIWLGAFIIFITFIWDYTGIIITTAFVRSIFSKTEERLADFNINFVPTYFHWNLFVIGMLLVYLAILLMVRRNAIIKK